jgi:hypothetical protein
MVGKFFKFAGDFQIFFQVFGVFVTDRFYLHAFIAGFLHADFIRRVIFFYHTADLE